jgi:hypothetical protein
MRPVTWWLKVTRGNTWGGNLWVRKIRMEHLPMPGESVHILWDADEEEDSIECRVKSRYWGHDGTAHLTLTPFIIDPDEHLEQNHRWVHDSPWRTAIEGEDLEERLAASGWKRYGE